MTPSDLSALRKTLHLTQAQLARELGVTRNTVNRWERGHNVIPPATARLLPILAAQRLLIQRRTP